MEELVGTEEVRLTMPATPQLLRVARLATAGLAGRLGFSFDEIEDVKIAVDELCFALVGGGSDGELTLTYQLSAGRLLIEGEADAGAAAVDPTPSELSKLILDAVVDEHRVSRDGGRLRFRLVKLRG
jgi:serine/threonine-protein kinase RsbW